ncbi:unnamed protein product [Rotaria sp. Silwood1]|nr:unnamed protein product [Rotaria sp. Silwood1]CAF1563396.1 unnamed protein product [Rotaria sp. Silwood1]CAF3832875.1 unnamed protein product [Rotaria sp. Silwood1]CAF4692165.1 unnamed protein product [Rotaria sp. Silwood1]CAF4966828.1 unnamed protein product [Rotaria sp. Silwood1]
MTMNRDTLLRIIICIHFTFISMVLMADWLPKSYLLNQVTILALGFWAIVHRENVIQVELLMLIEIFSIVLDSIGIGMYFQIGKQTYSTGSSIAYFVISALFAIVHLLIKPIILVLLNKVRQDRLSESTFGIWTPTPGYTPVDGR